MIEIKENPYSSEQLDKLIIEIEGRLNDFEGGISDKDETIKSFADLIGKIAVNVAKGEVNRFVRYWGKDVGSEIYLALNARLTTLEQQS